MLLSNLRIDDNVFYTLLQNTLNDLCKMFIEEDVAFFNIRRVTCGIHWESVKEANFNVTTEPYLRSMLMAQYRLNIPF